jgi:hypothetical protein
MTTLSKTTVFSIIFTAFRFLFRAVLFVCLTLGIAALMGSFFLSGNHADIVADCTKAITREFQSAATNRRLTICVDETYRSLKVLDEVLKLVGASLAIPAGMLLLILRFFRVRQKRRGGSQP